MKALIIDDEKRARETLIQVASLCCPDIDSFKQADSLLSAILSIQQERPDILFLDIDLGSDSGFDVLKHFEGEALNVIFVTGHNDYVLKALRASAVDYLLKPVKASELMAAVRKIKQKLSQQQQQESLDSLLQNLNNKEESIKKITISTADSIHVIHVADIIYCESDKGYTTFYLADSQKVMASKILREYEDLLPKDNFMRVHQSYLVNLNHVMRYDKKDKNFLVTTLNHKIPVSHRLKNKLINYFDKLT
ncbi:LytR/AlgR family response regulator transcription factor [Aureispira anguillae]|uniref:LytTR family DNA-binding domain-containing protein n=1 Tax=Aureispira anguillae TaxID=2864201 RepID=A0A916DPU3_9BACT|nr:LytTR family DNA-binding domain-containing protein [Aureispira anguillae]BDS10764.1 LytTR family DNA-binding domain-containing protein [Aureispira anguillae]